MLPEYGRYLLALAGAAPICGRSRTAGSSFRTTTSLSFRQAGHGPATVLRPAERSHASLRRVTARPNAGNHDHRSPDYLASYDGQVAALVACNLLGRLSPSVQIGYTVLPIHPHLPWAGCSLVRHTLEGMVATKPFRHLRCTPAGSGRLPFPSRAGRPRDDRARGRMERLHRSGAVTPATNQNGAAGMGANPDKTWISELNILLFAAARSSEGLD
ncbi:hypothetical protein MESS4_330157 [Mesorhizobium sp. STM 4661]|nr:hypothetical protein MESS4_330157 [Mesorhizobium sp. STM 4661]